MRKIARLCLLIAAVGSALSGYGAAASARALYFERVLVNTESEATCFRFADHIARFMEFRNTSITRSEVTGEKSGAYLAVTCIGRGQSPAMAIVMSVSPTSGVAEEVGAAVAERMRRIVCFDGPC